MVSRDPNDYYKSVHAFQQSKDRNIKNEEIAQTIANGEIKDSHKEGCKLFVNDYWYTDNPVGVVADIESGKIITVEWRK
jgi:hypothetical protein